MLCQVVLEPRLQWLLISSFNENLANIYDIFSMKEIAADFQLDLQVYEQFICNDAQIIHESCDSRIGGMTWWYTCEQGELWITLIIEWRIWSEIKVEN